MSYTIICVGRLKEDYLRQAQSEYLKRLSPYKARVIEIPPEKLPDSPSPAEKENALRKEGERIIAAIPKNSKKYALCIEGRQMTSEQFSAMLSKSMTAGASAHTFIIGGSFGLSDEVKALCEGKISFSPMTFPHQLFRIMLLEQLYRAEQIIQGTKYHK